MTTQNTGNWKPGDPIGYVRSEIPEFELPPYEGERYEALVPDTLDLAERAELAINGMTGPTDPKADYKLYWVANFLYDPPIMYHDWYDITEVKFMEALPLLRIVTGSDLNNHVDRARMEVLLKSVGPDGLFYIPLEGRPWSHETHDEHEEAIDRFPMWRADGTTTKLSDESVTQLTDTFLCGRIISAMTIYYLRDRNPLWKETIERMIQRLSQLAVDKGDYCYFPAGLFEPNAKVSPDAEMPTLYPSVEQGGGRLIQGLTHYYKVTGYEPARKLAKKLAKYLKDYSK